MSRGPTHFVLLIHPPRPTFLRDATPEELAVMGRHFQYLQGLADAGKLLLAGPTLDDGGFGLGIFKTTDEDEAKALVAADPAITSGLMRPELRPIRISFLKD